MTNFVKGHIVSNILVFMWALSYVFLCLLKKTNTQNLKNTEAILFLCIKDKPCAELVLQVLVCQYCNKTLAYYVSYNTDTNGWTIA